MVLVLIPAGLIPRFYDPQAGVVAIDGEDIRQFDHGCDTMVGQGGLPLSGGQRQRLGSRGPWCGTRRCGRHLRLNAVAGRPGSTRSSGRSMRTSRATLLALALWLGTVPPAGLAAQDEAFRVTLLGTGTPLPSLQRFGPSILVEAGGAKFLFDAGRGCTQRLAQARISFADLAGVFLTHLHSDHVVGLPDLWLTGWLLGTRARPLRVWGPPGTREMAGHLERAFAFDVGIRGADDKAPAGGGRMEATDLVEGVVYDSAGLRITAFAVDHGPVRPALGYRIDYRGRAVVLSGDTGPSANLIAHARGVDLLVHEVATATAADLAASELSRRILAHHTTPPQAAEVFRRTRPRLAVYSHIVLRPGAVSGDLVALTRPGYRGPLVVGEDRMRFTLGDSIAVDSVPGAPAGR